MSFALSLTLLGLALISVSSGQTIRSRDTTSLGYFCPNRQTIDTAYYNYCAARSKNNIALSGITSGVNYAQAPNSQTRDGDYTLSCYYGQGPLFCQYSGGAGKPLSLFDGSDGNCPAPPRSLPQPSAGANYRRRKVSLQDRANLGIIPRFTCPFTSTDTSLYLIDNQVRNGYDAISNGFTTDDTQISFACLFRYPSAQFGLRCFYTQVGSTVSFQMSNPSNLANLCPTTICTAMYTGTNNNPSRREVQDEGKQAIQRRQVDTQSLRAKLKRKQEKQKQRQK